MSMESLSEKPDDADNSKSKQEDEFFGYSPKEIKLLKKARAKYNTPENLLKGMEWVNKPGEKVKPKYHLAPLQEKKKK